MNELEIRREVARIAGDLEQIRPALRSLGRMVRRATFMHSGQDHKVAAEVEKFLRTLPDVKEGKLKSALLAFGQTLLVDDFFGSKHAPTQVANVWAGGDLDEGDAEVKVKLTFRVGLMEALNRAIAIAAGSDHNLRPGAKIPPAISSETAKFLAERAEWEMGKNPTFFKSLLQRNPQVVQELKDAFGTSQVKITKQDQFEAVPSGGILGAEAVVTVSVTLHLTV